MVYLRGSNFTKILCGKQGEWGWTDDGLDLKPCSREMTSTRGSYTSIPTTEQLEAEERERDQFIPISKYDYGQLVISFIHLGFVGFLFGWRVDEYDEKKHKYGVFWVVGAIGQFASWLYISALLACHLMTRKNQSRYGYLRHLLFLYALFFLTAIINLRSNLKNDQQKLRATLGYELVFAYWNVAACFVLFALSMLRPRHPELRRAPRRRRLSRDTTASLWGLISFSWISPIIKLGNKRALTSDELWELPPECQAAQCYDELDRLTNLDLLSRLLVANLTNLFTFLVIAIFRSIFAFTTPYFLQRLLEYIETEKADTPSELPYLFILGILISELLRVIFLNQLNYQVVWLGIRVEQMLSVMVYQKQLRLKLSLAKNGNNNRPHNVLTMDVDDIAGFFSNLPFLLTIPLEILVAMIYLARLLGWSSIIGVVVMTICLWSNKKMTRRIGRLQKRVKKARDERVGEIFELLHAVRMIKMFAWERSFHERLMFSRKIELNQIRKLFWRNTILTLVVHVTPFLVTLFAFASYTFGFNKVLTASKTFTSIALFNTLKQPLQILPNLVFELVGLGVALSRLERFLQEADVQNDNPVFSADLGDNTTIGFTEADVGWSYQMNNIRALNEFVLKGVDLEFPVGKLSVVCGHKGSGKSLLLLSLLRETFVLRGFVHFPTTSVAYITQKPWLEKATIRDNIIFSSTFDDERYWNVVETCNLSTDFENMEQADMTEYDDENLTLTDDQKARIALARAMYSSAQILLLDNCLESVDTVKARQLIESSLNSPFLSNRTVIIVSNHVRLFLNAAEFIVVLGDGVVSAKGTPQEVTEAGVLTDEILGTDTVNEQFNFDKTDELSINQALEKAESDKKNWASEEARIQGKVHPSIYYFYLKSSGGIFVWFILLLLFLIIRLLTVGETYLLKVWSEDKTINGALTFHIEDQTVPDSDSDTRGGNIKYIKIYALIAIASAAFTIVRMSLQLYISLKGSRTLFSKLLNSILRAPLSFFDTAPLGRVMNRFSKDLGIVDQGLLTVMASFLGNLVGAVCVLAVVTCVTWEFGFASIIIAISYIKIGSMYINVSRELKRLQSMTRTPVISWFCDTVGGITTIRAFNAERRFVKEFIEKLNESNRTTYLLHMSNRWMSLRLGTIGAFASYLAGYFILMNFQQIDAGLAGFSLSYALGFVQIVSMLVKDYTSMETSLNSVERIEEYIEMPQEPPAVIDNIHPPAAWPTNGNIEVSKLTVQYSPDQEIVLRDISFMVRAEEKIGIVGRTGSGKSTLANSFLRLVEPVDGNILIDGVDIANIGLEDLRSRITMISQDPILFEGSIRSNLDIRGEYEDRELWESLRRVHFVQFNEEGSTSDYSLFMSGPIQTLDDPVNEGGNNFSRGQRQLLCLARALLRQSKIIIMDEATASIDPETDNKIQETFRTEFQYATVLCVSHRFRTIIDSDRILVLDNGEIIEFDTPYNLISNPDGLFRHLCEATGELESLMQLASLVSPDGIICETQPEVEDEVIDNENTPQQPYALDPETGAENQGDDNSNDFSSQNVGEDEPSSQDLRQSSEVDENDNREEDEHDGHDEQDEEEEEEDQEYEEEEEGNDDESQDGYY
ncbi:9578_t:CDS:10 [Ambispora gerdemannii]|uniref:9578_t:CDS:1 n=1 Tax=Ambispora gerdemannii TaxID=144530 RepID=A0A9N8ZIB1_9GLOM|nr:9578_t:CDS:10 [Ambispora gerdemannii]